MSANIFGERFLGRREPAWHNIGTVFEEALSPREALMHAGADFRFILSPAVTQIETPLGTQLIEAKGKSFIVREPVADDPEYRITGIASDNYGLIQNEEIAIALERLTDNWPVETVGVLGKGETLFIALDAGVGEVKGEKIHQYFLVSDTKDGGTSLKIAFTPVRVVCQNTLVTGLRQATVSAALTHNSNVGAAFDVRIDLVSKMQAAQKFTMNLFETMANIALSDDEFTQVLEQVYPYPKVPKKMRMLEGLEDGDIAMLGELYDEATKAQYAFEYYVNRANILRDGAHTLFSKLNDEFPNIAHTAWAGYNAVVESADFREGPDSLFGSALFGSRAVEKRRAFAALSAL